MSNYKLYINEILVDNVPDNIILDIQGEGHKLFLHSFSGNGKLHIKLRGKDNLIHFGKNNKINRTLSITGLNYTNRECYGSCFIGNDNTFNGNVTISIPLTLNRYVKIGDSNLFANDVHLLGVTEHLVFNIHTHELLNKEDNIVIGNHNWIGKNTTFLTKAHIFDNSVVGLSSVVTKKFDKSNIMIAGNPARVRREEIYWEEYYQHE